MAVHLYFGNQLMPLAERLKQNLLSDGADQHVLDAPMVIVPNMNLSKWIKLTLSRQTEIFMNVEFAYLEDGLWQMIGSLATQTAPGTERLDRESLRTLLFFILMALDHSEEIAEPIVRYLSHPDGRARIDRELRCWQLAEELARLFQEYEYHRADMIHRWLNGRPPDDAMESCQQWLYMKAQSLKSQAAAVLGRHLQTMTEYAGGLPAPSAPGLAHHEQRFLRVHFFGLSQISPLHIELLSRLQIGYDIHIYSLNPSREYWEDIQTPVEKKWIARTQVGRLKLSDQEWAAGELSAPADHELLSAWGKPGRENIRLLCQLTDYDFEACFSSLPRQDTVLAAVNHGLLTLVTPRASASTALAQDTSLQIMACPGIRREVETVYNSIVYNLETDPDLCMTDIAVMVSDMSRYKPVVDSVFSQHPARIAYNLVDASASTESLFAQAVLSLMALARGTFTRKAVFDFLRNPCVMQRWRVTPETLAIWIQWADALGIFHGFENATDAEGTLPEAGLYSWRQGLERLRLSRIMTPPASPAGTERPHYQGLVPFADINTGDQRLLETFSAVIPALHRAVASLNIETRSARDWRDTFLQVVDQFIAITPDMRGEETVLHSLVDAFDRFVRYDALMQVASGPRLSAEALWAFVQSHLEGITGGQGDYLTGGVTVSALMPMRPIPFRIVYVLGLEEGRFPGRATDSLLDLRTRRRRIGDVSLPERNRYLFLEILISVHGKLYLSYIARDLQKDRNMAPCSVVQQLRRHVEQQVLGGRPFLIQEIPIRADSPRYLAPDAVNAWSDVMVNANVPQRLSAYRRSGIWDDLAGQVTAAEQQTLSRYTPDFSFPNPTAPVDATGAVSLTTGLLRRYLLDPVAVAGRYHLGAYETIDSTTQLSEISDEPLSSKFPIDFEIRTTPVQNWLMRSLGASHDPPTIPALTVEFDRVYADLTRRSRVPSGPFADPDRSRLQAEVVVCGETLLPYILAMRSAARLFPAVTLGAVADGGIDAAAASLSLQPLDIAMPDTGACNPPVMVQLSGAAPWIWQTEAGDWHCLVVTGSGRRPSDPDKYVLAPLLTLMAIAASCQPAPWSEAGVITLHLAYRERVQDYAYALDPDRCADYLKDLIGDFFTPHPMVWLPFETVFGDRSLLRRLRQDEVTDFDREAFAISMQGAMQEGLDPVTELYGASVPPDILDRARRRFRVFMAGS